MEARKVPKSRPGRNFPRYKKETIEKLPEIIAALQSGEQVSTIERDHRVSNATIYRVRRDLKAGVFDYLLKKNTVTDTNNSGPCLDSPEQTCLTR
jgi:hypothetical protein